MADDAEKALEELRERIAAEGLPKLSPEALRIFKAGSGQGRLRPVPQKASGDAPGLSEEARRLYHEKSNPHWLWRRR
jgi:hypothetical protein